MEAPLYTFDPPTENPRPLKTWQIVLLIVAILVLVGIGYYFLRKPHNVGQINQPMLFFGAAQTGPLYSLNPSATSSTPTLSQAAVVGGSTVLSMVKDSTNTYYLLLSADGHTSNLFKVPNANGGTLTQVTNTPTLKFQLSYDAPSHVLAYVSTTYNAPQDLFPNAKWKVSVLNTATGAQKNIGQGSAPVVLPGGSSVLFNDVQNNIGIITVSSGKETQLLKTASFAPYAVSPDAQTLAVYSPMTKTVDYYDLSKVLSVGYLHSDPAPFIPIGMVYENKSLVLVGTQGILSSQLIFQSIDDQTPITQFTSPIKVLFQQEFTISYE